MQRAPHNNILATPDYHEWRYLRKMTNPAFSPENIRKVSFGSQYAAWLWAPSAAVACCTSWLLAMMLHIPRASIDRQLDVLGMLCMLPLASAQLLICTNVYDRLLQP